MPQINAANWVGENTATIGIGSIALGGALSGFARFNVMGDGQVYYTIQDGVAKEVGIGTLSGNTLERTTVLSTMNLLGEYSETASPISLSGNAQVFATVAAEFMKKLYNDYDTVEASAESASNSAAAAKVSETNSKTSETNAAASASSADTSATNATQQAAASKTSADAALASQNAAKASETAAKTSETNAASSAASALASKNAAKTSETNAESSASAAAGSASAADISKNAAAGSATAAGQSATGASTSATNAANSATAALASQTASKTSENNAKTSETNAASSALSAKSDADRAQTANPDDQLKKANNLSDVANPATAWGNVYAGQVGPLLLKGDGVADSDAVSVKQLNVTIINNREQWRRSLEDAGLTLVDGSFEEGATANSKTDAVWYIAGGQCYTWDAVGTKTVPAKSTPDSSGGIGAGKWLSVINITMRGTLASSNGTSLIGDESGLTLKERLHFDESDISLYGYTYGSGLDAKDAILSAINRTGKAHLSGATTLSRFDWPEDARLTGKASITYTRVPAVPCELDSEIPVDHSLMRAVYVHQVFDICDMLQLKTAGFNTLIHYGQTWLNGGDMTKACNAAEAVGLKLILGGPVYGQTNTPAMDLNDRDCVIGYYLFDEPQNAPNVVSKANQDIRITNFKALTNKMLCIADHGIFAFNSITHSNGYNGIGYDIIFVDNYYHDDWDDARNKRQAVLGWSELKFKCPTARLIPCIGMFTTDAGAGSDNFKNKAKQLSFAKQYFNMGDGSFAAFSWESNLVAPTHKTITTDPDIYAQVNMYNSCPKQKPFTCDVFSFATDAMNGAVQLYNDKYSSVDVTPWQTVNTGTATSERNTTFKQGGIAAKNLGGVMATNLKGNGYIAVELYYFNGADSSNTGCAITTCNDDFFTNTDRLAFTFNSANPAFINSVETTPNLGIGLRLTPSVSYQWRWKMVAGGVVDCSWIGGSF